MKRTDTVDAPTDAAAEQSSPNDTNWLFARLSKGTLAALNRDQKEEIAKVINDPEWKRPPVNIRMSLPFFARRFFVTVIGGVEKRGPARRKHEAGRYPLRTIANIFFFVGIAMAFYIAAIVGLAFQSAIVEF